MDGAPFDKNGQQLYPIISWKCPRTVPVMENLPQLLDIKALYQRNGIGQYSFNTLFKLLWLKENKPDIFQKMDKFVFISSMLTQRLTSKFTTDRTMAGTSMMTNLATGNWDEDILKLLGLSQKHFPPLHNAGEKVGELTSALADHWGLNRIPVISCGHDTQFAVFGSGAGLNQPVLSSGTWEILMARTEHAKPQFDFVPQGLTTEFDAQLNCFNPAVQWVGSGIMDGSVNCCFADVYGTDQYYPTMIAEGAAAGEKGSQSAVNFRVYLANSDKAISVDFPCSPLVVKSTVPRFITWQTNSNKAWTYYNKSATSKRKACFASVAARKIHFGTKSVLMF